MIRTSRIKCHVPKISTLQYKDVSCGEVFVYDMRPYIKTNDGCISLQSGGFSNIDPLANVQMMEAELILKYRDGDHENH